MNYLKISNNKVFFTTTDDNKESYKSIDGITKEDILTLINIIMVNDEFKMDQYDSSIIGNTAHNIIYRHLYEKFDALINRKEKILEDVDTIFSDAYNKYQ